MKYLKKISIILALLSPFLVVAATSVPWQLNNISDTYISPLPVNGTTKGVVITASSTIGNGTQAGGLIINGSATTTFNSHILGNLVADNVAGSFPWSTIGQPLGIGGAILTTAGLAGDNFVSGTATTTSGNIRAGTFVALNNAPAAAGNTVQGLNAQCILGALATGNFTGSVATGGTCRGGRYIATNLLVGRNVAMMSAVSASVADSGTLASSTDNVDYNAEAPTIATGNLMTNFHAFWAHAAAVVGTLTNQAGLHADHLIAATNNTEVLIGSTTIPTGNHGFYQDPTDTYPNTFSGFLGNGTTTPDAQYAQLTASSTVNFAGVHDIFGVISGITYLFERIDGFMHLITSGPVPALSSCGTSTVSGNDRNGTVTLNGVALTSCTMTFARAYNTAPDCTVSDNTTASTADLDTTATTVTFGLSVGLNSGKLFYICQGHQ